MPGPLRDVEQRISLDASGYDAGTARIIEDNKAIIASIGDVNRKIAEMKALLGSIGDSKKIRIDVDTGDAMGKIAALKGELGSLGDKEITVAVRYVTTGDRPGGAGAAGGFGLGGDSAAMIRELRDISASMDMATSSMGRMEEHLAVIKRDTADSSADLQMQTQMLRDNADAHNAAATAVAALSAARGRSGGGGGGWAAAAGAGAAAGGGGGGGGAPGFVPWAGGGWQAVRFWGMMAAEVASTVIPAIVAAGSAAAVGAQGFEQLQNRISSVFTVSEALGGSLGMTTGQFFGGGNALQKAQDAAQGGVWELAGGLARIGKSGAGGGFLNMGTQTLGMIDRGFANLVTGVTQGDTGKKLLGALGGGPGYLRQFGDIGSNLGMAALNFAPNLPGVGADLLSTLTGATGLLRSASELPAPLLKGFFGYEALSRWGPALLGGQGLIGRMLGLRGVGGLGGLLGKGGAALFGRGMGGALGDVGLGMMGAGDTLAALTGPEIGLPLAALMAEWSALGMLPHGQAGGTVAGLQAQIAAGGFSSALHPLARAITVATGGAAAAPPVPVSGAPLGPDGRKLPAGRVAAGLQDMAVGADRAVYSQAAQGFAQQLGELVGAGPQLVTALKGLGMHGVTLANAFQLAQDAMIDIPHSFGPGGKLNKTALSQLASYVQIIGPMTQSPGAFGAAVAGQQIMSSGAMQNLAKVNQAMDSMSQIMQAGPAGMASLAALHAAAPPGMAHALTSFTSPGGAAAWQQFAGTSGSSVISQMQQFNDQMRTYLTLGSLGQGQAAGLTGFELKQFLPQARQSPAALAMLMQQGAQMGVTGYYDPSKSLAKNYQDAAAAAKKFGDSNAQAQKDMTHAVIATANLPAVAKQLLGQTGPAIQAQQVAKIAQDAANIQQGINVKANVGNLVGQLRAAGVQGGAALKQSLDAVLSQAGVAKPVRMKIEADASKALAAVNSVHGKNVDINIMTKGAQAAQAAMNAIHGKTVTVTIVQRVIQQVITSGAGAAAAAGIPSFSLPGGPAGMRIHGQTGKFIPGYGGGDIVPAMLEPGELVVPKHLVGSVAPILSGRIPGFAAGGFAGGVMGFEGMLTAAFHGDEVQNSLRQILDALIGPVISAHSSAIMARSGLHSADGSIGTGGGTGPGKTPLPTISQAAAQAMAAYQAAAHAGGKQFSVHVLQGLMDGIKNAGPASRAAAAALLSKMQQEMAYAKSTAANMTAGLNFGGMNVDPATGSGPVQTQMQSYAASLKAFSADIKAMTKGGLNKDLLKQMIAAGPVQGDALAQSISQGPGGIRAVNQLYAQIQHLSKGIGAQAAGAVYGGTVAPNLKSGTFITNNVSVSISGGSGTGDLATLTPKQLKSLMEQIQRELLKQAHRNRKTGTTVKGKGA